MASPTRAKLAAAAQADAAAQVDAEAKAVLWVQAVAVANIKTLVPGDLSAPDATWSRLDATVVSWLYNSVSSEILEMVMINDNPNAATIWASIVDLFQNNKESRALYLEAEFKNFVQGDLSVSDYCHKMKTFADALADVDQPVTDKSLVLNTLRGLNDKFAHLRPIFGAQRPFPSFLDVQTTLLLEEIHKNADASCPLALLSSTTGIKGSGGSHQPTSTSGGSDPGARGSGNSGSNSSGGSSSGSYGSNNQRHRNRSGHYNGAQRFNNRDGAGQNNRRPQASWPTVFNPWTGTLQLWSGPPQGQAVQASLLGSRPT
ncbi:uncharacterized protein LOC133911605 [Phragmites australis]|uniref:uncharacterized protein LOC133911605 n=1 Tax=Phragmites australis TaxID=29695 RepID=UPI002D79EB78|nr:uncharacterized protein LOC133911605 [Phragmites australis]